MSEHLAPAKLTWTLEVGERRGDGRHALRAEMTTLEFADRLVIDEDGDYLVVEGAFAAELASDNLVRAALAFVDRRAGVTLHKVIPPGGGLGGGSADAAAIVRWAGGVSAPETLALGADVPFCVVGGRAIVEGAGEVLTPLEALRRDVTLLLVGFGVSTAACYDAFDELVAGGERPKGRNHLREAARRVSPALARTMDWLAAEIGQPVELAGSGSTLFVEGHLGLGASLHGPEGPVSVVETATTGLS